MHNRDNGKTDARSNNANFFVEYRHDGAMMSVICGGVDAGVHDVGIQRANLAKAERLSLYVLGLLSGLILQGNTEIKG